MLNRSDYSSPLFHSTGEERWLSQTRLIEHLCWTKRAERDEIKQSGILPIVKLVFKGRRNDKSKELSTEKEKRECQ